MDAIYAILPRGLLAPEHLVFKNGVRKVAKKAKIKKAEDEEYSDFAEEGKAQSEAEVYGFNGKTHGDKAEDKKPSIDFEA